MESELRILYNSPLSPDAPGPGRPLKAIRNGLDRSGHDVRVIEWKQNMGLGPEHDLFRATVYDLINGYEPPEGWYPEVFLGPGGGCLVQMDYWKTRSKIVTTWFSTHYSNVYRIMDEEIKSRGWSGPPIHPFLLWRAKKEQERTHGIIVPSKQCAATYEQVPECQGKTRVVEFGVDSEVFHPRETPPKGFQVLYAGGNGIRKGLRYLMEAWMELPKKSGDVLNILGTDSGYNDRFIHNWRWIPDHAVPQKYRESNVFCLPSLEEGQALVVLEAMASGLPVIISRQTGVEIEEGREGFYVPVKDPEAIRKALEYLRDDPQKREEMGRHAREYAVNRPWEKFGDGVVRVLEEMA